MFQSIWLQFSESFSTFDFILTSLRGKIRMISKKHNCNVLLWREFGQEIIKESHDAVAHLAKLHLDILEIRFKRQYVESKAIDWIQSFKIDTSIFDQVCLNLPEYNCCYLSGFDSFAFENLCREDIIDFGKRVEILTERSHELKSGFLECILYDNSLLDYCHRLALVY